MQETPIIIDTGTACTSPAHEIDCLK